MFISKHARNGLWLVLCLVYLVSPSVLHAKIKMLSISSANEKLEIRNFHIESIVDERKDQSNIGYITTGAHNFFLQANFKQSVPDEINQFLRENTTQHNTSEPMTLHISDYTLFEQLSFKGAEIGIFTHYILYNKNGDRIYDYAITEYRNTGMNMGANAGELMCRNLSNYLKDADVKIPSFIAFYKGDKPIKVNYVFLKQPDQKEFLPFNPLKPLNKFNFGGQPPANSTNQSFAVCGIFIDYQIRKSEKDSMDPELFVAIMPYLDQSKSWIKNGADVTRQLAVQQTYFKITAYLSNELVKELQSRTFVYKNIGKEIEGVKIKYQKQLDSLQQLYQSETEQGENLAAVEQWNRKIAFAPVY